ncbi:RHS repeat-associated core domain-containing protein, partial [Streptomyces sp. NPDC048419]|uniref:RHS repeat-associated core domain-containing protein n=1 Tax=Streptomyces sp. NPDC048419 TaxID=3365547 RepID=UPI003722D32C
GVDWGLNTLLSTGAARLHDEGQITDLGAGAQALMKRDAAVESSRLVASSRSISCHWVFSWSSFSPTASGTASTNPYTFTGREMDGTGLLYYRDRYYDPQTSQFISQDPSGQAGGTNLYQYALSSPTTYTDPDGNNPMIAACVVGGLMDGGLDWLSQRLSGRKVNWGQVGQSAAIGCLSGMLGEGLGTALEGKLGSKLGSCALPNSFTGDTPVLMADGTRKPIKDVAVGDTVMATDPETGNTGPRKVTALIKGEGEKHLVDITLDTDGHARAKTSTITATDGHPFWVPQLHRWVEASNLAAGQWLQTSSGTWVQIKAVRHHTQQASVNNLTVEGLHTYYVLAGKTPLLVHNAGCGETTYYHGADVDSLLDILNNSLNSSKAAAKYTDGPGGFFVATHAGDAEFFATRHGGGAIIKVIISDDAMAQLRNAGAVARPIPMSPKSPTFAGDEFHIPTSAFDLFNQLRASGGIRVSP